MDATAVDAGKQAERALAGVSEIRDKLKALRAEIVKGNKDVEQKLEEATVTRGEWQTRARASLQGMRMPRGVNSEVAQLWWEALVERQTRQPQSKQPRR